MSRRHGRRRSAAILVSLLVATLAPQVPPAFSAGAAVPLVGDAAGALKLAVKYGDEVVGAVAGVAHVGDDALDVAGAAMRRSDDVPIGAACSFAALTLVRTSEGDVPIAAIDVGDEVLASDETSGTTGAYPVTAVWSHPDDVTGTVAIDSDVIALTPEHPVRTVDRGWLPAAELRIGDAIVSLTGDPDIVEAIAWDGGPDVMWNLTVATAHTYTVGDGGWLVHNDCSGGLSFSDSQLSSQLQQHGDSFGAGLSNSSAGRRDYMSELVDHIDDPSTTVIQGTYRGQPAIHYVQDNGLDVFTTPEGGFWGAWRLGPDQLENVLLRGNLR